MNRASWSESGKYAPSRSSKAVAASSNDARRPGVLSGNYAGVAVDGSIGVGGGGKALVGGWRNSVTLQPLSAQAQTGLNLAIGVSGLKLRQ